MGVCICVGKEDGEFKERKKCTEYTDACTKRLAMYQQGWCQNNNNHPFTLFIYFTIEQYRSPNKSRTHNHTHTSGHSNN